MAITRVQVSEGKVEGTPASSMVTANFASGVTSGNLIVVFARWYTASSYEATTVTDTLSTVYTSRQEANSNNTGMAMFSGVATAGGTNAVTMNFSGDVTWGWIYALEYSCSGTWAYDTSAQGLDVDGLTDVNVGNTISTANAEELVILGATQVNGAATFTAGTDFTLIDGDIESEGGIEQYITTGTLSSYDGHITTTNGNPHILIIGAFKYTATSTGQFARPASDVADGNWLNASSSNTNIYASIDETTAGGAGDDDYIRSGATPSNDTCTVGLSGISTPGAGTVTMRIRARYL